MSDGPEEIELFLDIGDWVIEEYEVRGGLDRLVSVLRLRFGFKELFYWVLLEEGLFSKFTCVSDRVALD